MDADKSFTGSSIRRLPNEILGIIFLSCCEPAELRGFVTLETTQEPVSSIYDTMALDALSLSHVCCNWRHIALSFPALWTDISVCLEDGFNYTQKELDSCHDIVPLYLQRSEELPLSIRLRFPIGIELRGIDPEDPNPPFEWHQAIVLTLLDHSKRWSQACIGMCRFNINYLAWNGGSSSFSELQIAALECFHDDQYIGPEDQEVDEVLVFPMEDAPELCTLFLNNTPFSLNSPIPSLPFLSHLEIQGHSSNPLAALEWAADGCDVVVRDIPDQLEHMDSMQEWESIQCDTTSSLTFEISSNSQFSRVLFERVAYSPVDTLRFVASNESGEISSFPLGHFRESTLDLDPEALELVHLQISEEDLIEIISAASRGGRLKSLSVYENEHHPRRPCVPLLTTNTLKQLHASQGSSPLVPVLENLTLSFKFSFDEVELLGMIESRIASTKVTPLQSVALHLMEDMEVTERFRQRVRALEARGMLFSVSVQ